MSDNIIDYSYFRVKKILKNKSSDIKISDEERRLLSDWLSKNTDLNSLIYTDVIEKRDNKESLTEVEKVILRNWAIKKATHAASLLDW